MRWLFRLGMAAVFAVGLVALVAWLTVRAMESNSEDCLTGLVR